MRRCSGEDVSEYFLMCIRRKVEGEIQKKNEERPNKRRKPYSSL